ncbi:uncharacterized protein BCR38DRAFT_166937 [Pseudomassariella vexata]|uniref:Uncharacterized protein n=1 Tax=Pseudomassariella vexata TaxID=1141098 RepID=A0A1Y2E2R0_9PEZI|nr:uncharacterized protein BCR38DRAFT_166937 [Pseudomassariella vexata]ORY65822.1 hypothetical protein BCR38DRAFT_166937 [Pseudomassariella vexata]
MRSLWSDLRKGEKHLDPYLIVSSNGYGAYICIAGEFVKTVVAITYNTESEKSTPKFPNLAQGSLHYILLKNLSISQGRNQEKGTRMASHSREMLCKPVVGARSDRRCLYRDRLTANNHIKYHAFFLHTQRIRTASIWNVTALRWLPVPYIWAPTVDVERWLVTDKVEPSR